MDKKKRILIVDDYPILREELRSLLSSHQDFEIVGGAEDGLEAIEFVEKLQPDLVLMDLIHAPNEWSGRHPENQEKMARD